MKQLWGLLKRVTMIIYHRILVIIAFYWHRFIAISLFYIKGIVSSKWMNRKVITGLTFPLMNDVKALEWCDILHIHSQKNVNHFPTIFVILTNYYHYKIVVGMLKGFTSCLCWTLQHKKIKVASFMNVLFQHHLWDEENVCVLLIIE